MADPSVPDLPSRVQRIAGPAQNEFTFPFLLDDAAHLKVWIGTTPAAGFVVSGVGNINGGKVTFPAVLPEGSRVTISRVLPLGRQSKLPTDGIVTVSPMEAELNRLTMTVQQLDDKAGRAITTPEFDDPAAQPVIPAAEIRAGKVLAFDADGKMIASTRSLTDIEAGSTMPGPAGPQGAQGPAGPQGPQGAQGAQGPAGPQGVAGPIGPVGPAGQVGPQGPQGLQGPGGPQGPQGLQGPQGNPGQSFTPDVVGIMAQRATYDAEPAEFSFLASDTGQLYFKLSNAAADWSDPIFFGRGDAGPQGPQGIQGPQGDQGPQGIQGPQGLQGLQGPKGMRWLGPWSAATAYVGDDAVRHNGSAYIAVADSLNDEPPGDGSKWHLLASKGDQGIQGPQGAQGIQGPQGDQGIQGIQGPQGVAGANGANGLTWLGAWSAATAYAINDAVAVDGSSYICIAPNTNHAPAATPASWAPLAVKGAQGNTGAQGTKGMVWRGGWSAATAYVVDDVVHYSGSSYICRVNNTNMVPPSNVAQWNLVAQQGAQGPQGAPGGSNCTSNCDCNCVCDCCFVAGTLVTMADGSLQAIETIRVGDKVLGAHGEVNEVLALLPTTVGSKRMYSINGALITTEDHPILAPGNQWTAIEFGPLRDAAGSLHPAILSGGFDGQPGAMYERRYTLADDGVIPLKPRMMIWHHGEVVYVETIEPVAVDSAERLYHLAVSGSHVYRANGFVVSGWPEPDFDYQAWKAKG